MSKKKQKTLKERKLANKKKHENVNWQLQTQKIVNQLEKKGYDVEFTKDDGQSTVDLETKEVCIHSGHNPEITFYTLVHEYGHTLVAENTSEYSQNIGFVYLNFSDKSLTWRVNELNEEYAAWHVGYKQAKRLGLKINRTKFEEYKTKCIVSYIDWIGSKRNNND